MSTFPYALTRAGVVMRPDRADPNQVEGVLNPGAAFDREGGLKLFPRLVASGNRSRIGVADVEVVDGVPTGVTLTGLALEPDRAWEHGEHHGGVEDARVTFVPALDTYLMTYVAYGPLGPHAALATSDDLRSWTRRGPIQFVYEDELDTDLNIFPNKDLLYFPEPVTAPDGRPAIGFIHRPMWTAPGLVSDLPANSTDERQSIWISYVALDDARADIRALLHPWGHHELAVPVADWESIKLGGGPPPVRVPEGWLFLYHGVSGSLSDNPFDQQKHVRYSAGGMILDADDPRRVLMRTSEPLLTPETEQEREGIVGNVVFPTAIVDIAGTLYCFYGMADEAIGVARIDRV